MKSQKAKVKTKKLVSTLELAGELGCSTQHLLRLRQDGLFKPKTHWIIVNPRARRPTYRWNLNRCLESFDSWLNP